MAMDVTYNGAKIIDGLEVTPPVTVTYNGSTIATLNAGDTKTLQCNGKVMASDISIGDKTLQCSGKLMASDVVVEVGGVTPTSETWVINSIPNMIGLHDTVIAFVSNNTNFAKIVNNSNLLMYDSTLIYMSGMWANQAYRTVTFLEPPTGTLLTWLQANAVKQ